MTYLIAIMCFNNSYSIPDTAEYKIITDNKVTEDFLGIA